MSDFFGGETGVRIWFQETGEQVSGYGLGK
jgi:hypothetical protein